MRSGCLTAHRLVTVHRLVSVSDCVRVKSRVRDVVKLKVMDHGEVIVSIMVRDVFLASLVVAQPQASRMIMCSSGVRSSNTVFFL